MQRNNGKCWQCSISWSISKSSMLINKIEIEQIKDANQKIYSDFSIFNGKLFFKECEVFSFS